jgi:hypothetical protein
MTYVAPSTVTTLQTYTSAAHNVIVNDVIDHETRLNSLPRGYVTAVLLTSFSTTSTSYVDVTGLTVTFTAEADRRYLVSLYSAMTNNTSNLCTAVINDGTNDIAEAYTVNLANQILTSTIFAYTTPAAGSVTYKVRMQVQGGTGEMYGTTTRASLGAKLLVTDIGSTV